MSDLKRVIGERMRKLRKAKGLTQLDVAAAAGLDFTTVGAAERGVTSLSLKSLQKVAEALEVEVAELVQTPTRAATEKDLLILELTALLKQSDLLQVRLALEMTKTIVSVLTPPSGKQKQRKT